MSSRHALHDQAANKPEENHLPSISITPPPPLTKALVQFTIGSMVSIPTQRGPPLQGVVQWIGTVPDFPDAIAGVELEEPLTGCTDGTWQGRRFFNCPPGRAFFCPATALIKQDTRFIDEGQIPAKLRYDLKNPLDYVPTVEEYDTMFTPELFTKYIGDEHGIQGRHNSSYLDSTVFGLFALSDSFDELLLEEPQEEVGRQVKYYLWKGIVNPLRKYGLARHESVMSLRNCLEEFGRMKGANTNEKNPEEFLNLLFKEVLHVDPFLSIKRPFGVEKEYFVPLVFEINPCKETEIPRTGKLLVQMFHEQISFTRVPSKLLLQIIVPHFKDFKIIPSLTLDVKPLLDPNVSKCFTCSLNTITHVCFTCPMSTPNCRDASYLSYCSDCNDEIHTNCDDFHCVQEASPMQITKLQLLSVICIETSHYVCYTRSGDRWLFHDSMADRVHDMYNIPKVVDVTQELQDWVYSEKNARRLKKTPAKELPEYVRRFTQDIYMCVYIFDERIDVRKATIRANRMRQERDSLITGMKELEEAYIASSTASIQSKESYRLLQEKHEELMAKKKKEFVQLQEMLRYEERECKKIGENYCVLKRSHNDLLIAHSETKKSFSQLKFLLEGKEEECHQLQQSHDILLAREQENEKRFLQLQDTHQELTRQMENVQQSIAALQREKDQLTAKKSRLETQVRLLSLGSNKRGTCSWTISHKEITQSKEELGRGGWGVVWLGEFRGQKVAVKQMYETIASPRYLELLHREISIMAQLRHPNLLQFIGAVFDHPSGHPMIITEVMDTSIRNAYETKLLVPTPACQPVILSIMRDVAVGLNYLHCLPEPIIHRDVSSANVLLESKGEGKWKTKISDFGSANIARSAVTKGPGALVYSAPEVLQSVTTLHKKKQTSKVDSFSFGVLLCEVITCQFPGDNQFQDLLQQVQATSPAPVYDLVASCISEESQKRPTMAETIAQLDIVLKQK